MEIFNLYFGKLHPGKGFNSVKVGPYRICVKENYSSLVAFLPQYDRITGSIEGKWEKFIPGNANGWIATADCHFDGQSEPSILTWKPRDDNGIWDLCQILTFLNGRCITCDPDDKDLNPNEFGSRACKDIEVLRAAEIMWQNRHKFVDRKLVNPLLLYNTAFRCHDLNVQAGVISPALDGIYNDWRRNIKAETMVGNLEAKKLSQNYIDLTDGEKDAAKGAVNTAIDSIQNLDAGKKIALKNLVGGKISAGLLAPVNLIQAMLISEEIISENPCAEILDRIKFINKARNSFVHYGSPPEFKKNPDLSVEFSIFIIGRLIPDIIRMYLGKVAGFTNRSVGSLSQHKHEFQRYFKDGMYKGFKVEIESFDEIIGEL